MAAIGLLGILEVLTKEPSMRQRPSTGKIGWVLLWLLGIPLPVLLLLYVLRGCT